MSDVLEQESAPAPKQRKPPRSPDTLTRVGAERLCEKLDAFWHAAGFTAVRHWVELASSARGDVFVIRSNLINGKPPR
ncbi:MAG TPA: hypothetical protein VKI44_01430 [Acetobacteraceae bacterium]|nr:hypothetical protein [Acetobacteraceae bacterium]